MDRTKKLKTSKITENPFPQNHCNRDLEDYTPARLWVDNALAVKLIRLATPSEYGKFVEQYWLGGGKLAQVYDYNQTDEVYYALKTLTLPTLWGVSALALIVPPKRKVNTTGLGHSRIYRLADGTAEGTVDVYADTKIQNQQLLAIIEELRALNFSCED